MFPDTTSEWKGYPSAIDGVRRPYVRLIAGLPGSINLLVLGDGVPEGGFGVTAPVLLYWLVDEFEYSVTGHGLPSLAYKGGVYVKRARRSKLIQAYSDDGILSANFPNVQHFAFVGGDDCVEFLTQSDLTIVPFHSVEARHEWVQQVHEQMRNSLLGSG
ncbi:MAG: hypothetical protein B7Z08_08625 [Sphingomonadales bacterium 32-68-7]|nr:MAG: hypothetical protein B7Z33_04285 [Sphingomonadales bacterium 12-68-11]OYX08636.1 MAG: hypothetical protein B7Z08_08625 [Sphingomonadales bacterium 32-68-7]